MGWRKAPARNAKPGVVPNHCALIAFGSGSMTVRSLTRWLIIVISLASLCFLAGCSQAASQDPATPLPEPADTQAAPPETPDVPANQDVQPPPRETDPQGEGLAVSEALRTLRGLWDDSPDAAVQYAIDRGLPVEDSRVLVTAKVSDGYPVEEVNADLLALDSEILANYESLFDVWVPVDRLYDLAGLPYVEYVTEPAVAIPLPSEREDESH